jgi:hypothetical protein
VGSDTEPGTGGGAGVGASWASTGCAAVSAMPRTTADFLDNRRIPAPVLSEADEECYNITFLRRKHPEASCEGLTRRAPYGFGTPTAVASSM